MTINQANARKEINKIAKAAGLIFKRQNATINGAQAYQFLNRLTGEKVVENMTFWSAYENCMSGYISEKLVK
jgi:K+-transporting ATPase c subunit